ncbi:MAG: hypothetical protein WEC12_03765 [Balneolaceae bacterium]
MPQNSLKIFSHEDPQVAPFIEELKEVNVDRSYYLLLLTGPYIKGKKRFLEKMSSAFGRTVTHTDLRDVVTPNLKETQKNIDDLFNSLTEDDYLLFFSHGDRLCGAYTGFTYSKTRYVTPQERYLLEKLKNLEKIVIFDIQDEDNIDNRLKRYAHSLIRFRKPRSLWKRFTWKMDNIDFHGHTFTSKRPLRETGGLKN